MQACIKQAQRLNGEGMIWSGSESGLTLIQISILVGLATQEQ